MASENKTEKATPYRRGKLRTEGNVAKSPEVISALLILISVGALFFLGYKIVRLFYIVFIEGIDKSYDPYFGNADLSNFMAFSFENLFKNISPFLILAVVVVILGYVLQFGFIFTLKPLEPNFSKLNPVEGIKNLFNLNTIFELIKNSLKVILLMAISFLILYLSFHALSTSPYMPVGASLIEMSKIIFKLLIAIGIAGLMLAVIDFLYKKFDYEKRIKMSKQEIKDEFKQFEGNVEVKAKIRRRMRELSRARMMQEVPKASVVITNPTHFAVALRYIYKQDKAPVVIAKGQDYIAKKIIEIAELNDIQIIRKPELARALYKSVDIGEEIPPEFYKAVAEIIAYVVKKKQRQVL